MKVRRDPLALVLFVFVFFFSTLHNLVPRTFSLRKWEGQEETLASAGRFCFRIGCLKCDNLCNLYANVVQLNFILKMAVIMEVMPTKAFYQRSGYYALFGI